MRNGRIGMIDRFEIFSSNNISGVTDGSYTAYHAVATVPKRVAFASQITNVEHMPNPNDFGELIRGLNVYGYKVLNGDGVVDLYIRKG